VFDVIRSPSRDEPASPKPWRRTPTFFEVSTAIAFEIFKRAAVDVAVVEVGLGGRFDATNVLTPAITAITSIAFDHERHLGHTLSEIAFEKAGIAKRGVPLVIGRLPPEAAARIATVAREVEAPLFDAHATTDRQYPPLTLSLPGRHQLENAAVAVAILERWSALVGHISTEAIVTGLTDCEWPARLEWLRVPPNGELLIDAAHNPAGAAALASYLQDTGSEKLPIVFAAMADKDLTRMIGALAPIASAFIATTVPHARARTADQLASEIRRLTSVPVEAAASPEAAVARALQQVEAGRRVRIDLHDRSVTGAPPRRWRDPSVGCYSRNHPRALSASSSSRARWPRCSSRAMPARRPFPAGTPSNSRSSASTPIASA
jgi:dihydrofolate synthase/folylpolyglutamate synthase